jgi:hypothetical protein
MLYSLELLELDETTDLVIFSRISPQATAYRVSGLAKDATKIKGMREQHAGFQGPSRILPKEGRRDSNIQRFDHLSASGERVTLKRPAEIGKAPRLRRLRL